MYLKTAAAIDQDEMGIEKTHTHIHTYVSERERER